MTQPRKTAFLKQFGDEKSFSCKGCRVMMRDNVLGFALQHGSQIKELKKRLENVVDGYRTHRNLQAFEHSLRDLFGGYHIDNLVFDFSFDGTGGQPTGIRKIIVKIPFCGNVDFPINVDLYY